MGYRLLMSEEFHDWLTELRDRDPFTAMLVARALAALATEGDQLGPPLLTAVPDHLEPDQLLPALEQRYQDLLDAMAASRRRIATADADQKQLLPAHRRQQAQADAFRTRMETLKALSGAAQAELFIEQAQAEAADDDAVAAATTRLAELTAQIEQEVGWTPPAAGLLELRPGAPADLGLRILFAIEPPGTARLIAVLEGPDAVRDHYHQAVQLASAALRSARSGPDPDPAARTYPDAWSLLDDFFPHRATKPS